MSDFLTGLLHFNISMLVKIPLLLLIGLYIIFVFFMWNQVKSLNKLILIPHSSAQIILVFLAFVQLLIAISLFGIAVVIL